MARIGDVTKRPGTKNYQAQKRVPADLVNVVGKTHLTKTVSTSDYKEARRRARPIIDAWEAWFLDLRARRDMTEADLQAAAVEHWNRSLEEDINRRNQYPTAADREAAKQDLHERINRGEFSGEGGGRIAVLNAMLDYPALLDLPDLERARRTFLLKEFQKFAATGETGLIEPWVDFYIERHKLTVEKGSSEYRDLAHRIQRAEIDALKRTLERDQGDFTGQPNDPILSDVTIAPRSDATFESIIDEQVKRNAHGIGGRKKAHNTVRKYKIVLGAFAKWRGSARVSTVTVTEVEQWRDFLLTVNERKTVHDKLSSVKTVLNWAERQTKGKIFPKGHPLKHLDLPAKPESDSADKTYTVKQAQMILKAARKESKPSLRWIPWLEAYTGARINEVVPLEKQDVFNVGNNWFIHIRPDEIEGQLTRQGRTVKGNGGGKGRKVPLHADLVAEGFIEFVFGCSDGRLFPDPRTEGDTRDWIKDVMQGPKTNNPPPNHGFRHLWEDLVFARLNRDAALYMAGRASKTSDKLYGKSNAMLPVLAQEMNKLPSIIGYKFPL